MYIQVILTDSFSCFYQKIGDATHDFVLVKEAHSQGEFYMSVYASVQAYVAVLLPVVLVKLQLKLGGLQLRQFSVCAGMSTAQGFLRSKASLTQRSREGQGYSDTKGENTSAQLQDQASCVAPC